MIAVDVDYNCRVVPPAIGLLLRDDPAAPAALLGARLPALVAAALEADVAQLLLELHEPAGRHGGLAPVALDPFVALAAIEAPPTLGLGCLAPVGDMLAPSLLAKFVSTLALCREAEVELLLRPGARAGGGALVEAYDLVLAMLEQEAPSLEGRWFRIEGAWNEPRPVRRPRLGLLVDAEPGVPLPGALDDVLVTLSSRRFVAAGPRRLLLRIDELERATVLEGEEGVVLAMPAGSSPEQVGTGLSALRRALAR